MPGSLLLNIPEPCHENWQNMTPQEQGRFCGSCQKIVVDFSAMTDKEILAYFSVASQQVCGRFSNDQLNKELEMPPARKRITWAYIWNVLLASVLVTKTYAQGVPQVKKQRLLPAIAQKPVVVGWTTTSLDPVDVVIPDKIKGVVLDAQTNQPVPGASMRIKGTQNGTSADATGNFEWPVENKHTLELEFSAIGYEPQTVQLNTTTDRKPLQVLLKPAAAVLQEVTVMGYGTCIKHAYLGSAAISYRLKKSEEIKRIINDWTPAALKKDIKVYPNPVMRGNAMQVKLNLPQEGAYRLEVLNTAGQVMLVQPLFMQTKEQQVGVYTQTKWSAGIYYIRISSPASKKVFEAKVMLQ